MADPVRKGPVPEDLLAVTGHCCSVRLTRLADLDEGIDFTPDAAARTAFAQLQATATATRSSIDAAVKGHAQASAPDD